MLQHLCIHLSMWSRDQSNKNGLYWIYHYQITIIMTVTFHQKNNEFGCYWGARIESPYGEVINVDPFTPLECSISHQSKLGKTGFGVKFTNGKTSRVLRARTVGEAETFLREINTKLSERWFWKQAGENDY